MENQTDISLAEKFAAAQDWWRDAGVDQDFTDEITALLAEEEPAKPAPAAKAPTEAKAEPQPAAPLLTQSDLPDELAAFRAWWTGDGNPFAHSPAQTVAPRGEAEAPIMVVTTMPEAGDSERLLDGAHGQLIANILRAIDIDPAGAYFASALPAHMPLPDWDRLAADGLGAALARHVQLARPQRVLLFGSKLPTLLGHDASAPPEGFAAIGETGTLVTFAPDRLLDHARQRARLWKRLLEWTAPR